MHIHFRSWLQTANLACGLLSIGICLIFSPLISAMALSPQREMPSPSVIGLEIRLTSESPPIRLGGRPGVAPRDRHPARVIEDQRPARLVNSMLLWSSG